MDRSPHFSLSLNSPENNTKTWVMHRALPTIPSRWRWLNLGEQNMCNVGVGRVIVFVQWLCSEAEASTP